jgi:MFS family permease
MSSSYVYAYTFLRGFTFILPVLALYLQNQLNNLFYVSIVLSVMALSTTLFEVPGGWFADTYGRVHSLQLSSITMFFALISLFQGTFLFLLGYAILRGLADSLASGSDIALLYDNVKASDIAQSESHRAELGKVISLNSSMWPLGAGIGSFIGGFLMLRSYELPILFSLVPVTIGLLLTFWIKESVYKGSTHIKINFSLMKPILLLIIASTIYYSLDVVAHQWKSLYFEAQLVPLYLFGTIFMVTFILSSLGSYLSHFMRNKYTLPIAALCSVILLYCSTLAVGVLSAVLLTLCSFCYGVQVPKLMGLYNEHFSSSKRATLISVTNLLNRLGLFIGMLVLGYTSKFWSIIFIYKLIGTVCGVVPLLYFIFIQTQTRP